MDPKLLRIYCNDHLAAATGTLDLCRRAARTSGGTARGDHLAALAEQLAEDVTALRDLMARLGVTVDALKVAGARLGERVGRLKLNGRVVRPSPLSGLVELDALDAAIAFKGALWSTLGSLVDDVEALDRAALEALAERARAQRAGLERHRGDAVRAAFGTPPGGAAGHDAPREAGIV